MPPWANLEGRFPAKEDLCEFESRRWRLSSKHSLVVQAAVNREVVCPNHTEDVEVLKMKNVVDVDLAEDIKELLAKNPDVHLADALKKKILDAKDDDLLMTTTNFEHGIEITAVELVTPELIAKGLK